MRRLKWKRQIKSRSEPEDSGIMDSWRKSKAGYVLASSLIVVAGLHAFWALGGSWGLQTAIGEGNPLPPRLVIWTVVLMLTGAVLVVLGRVGLWGNSLPAWIFSVGTWSLCAALIVVAGANFTTGRPWDVWVFAPLSLLLAALAGVVARSARRAA
jgi:hypothetical protein